MKNNLKAGQKVLLNGKCATLVGVVNNLPMVNDGEKVYIVGWEDLQNGDN